MNTKKTLGLTGNYMDVEETIYALEKLEKRELNYESQSIHRAIDLLKRGEKYEQMWKKLKNKSGFRKIEHVFVEFQSTIEEIMESYEREYFPKPSDNFTEKVMEKINKKGGNQ